LPEYAVGGRGVQEDKGDQYNSVVMILLPDNSFCSGVLITNLVTAISTTTEVKEFRMGPEGVHPFGGDSGAPCFRETQEGRWLVGINYGFLARGMQSESWFTVPVHG
jgi:hypothetical protein